MANGYRKDLAHVLYRDNDTTDRHDICTRILQLAPGNTNSLLIMCGLRHHPQDATPTGPNLQCGDAASDGTLTPTLRVDIWPSTRPENDYN
jgi:hypothetical protein